MMPTSKMVPKGAILLLGGIVHFVLAAPANAQTVPRYIYGAGARGYGYYLNPAAAAAPRTAVTPRAAAAPRAAATAPRPRSVGPGARDWTTGRRGRLHKPWLGPMN